MQRCRVCRASYSRLISEPLAVGQFDALLSTALNLGSGAVQRFTNRDKVNQQAHQEVPE